MTSEHYFNWVALVPWKYHKSFRKKADTQEKEPVSKDIQKIIVTHNIFQNEYSTNDTLCNRQYCNQDTKSRCTQRLV